MNAIEINDLTKVLKGRTVLSHVTLNLEQSGSYGFYGHNGSGKSMLFRAIAGLIHPTEGTVKVFGKQLGTDISFPESMGLIIENVGFWSYYTGFENLKVLASIKHIATEEDIKNVMRQVALDPEDTRTYKKYSLGMKQKLAIAQAVMEKPQLIILDEPTNALDEEAVDAVRKLIRNEQEQRGATVLIASHNKEDLKQMCDKFYKMNDGKLEEGDLQQ
jgi:ABC-2 type transport system ATP-binding protein